MAQSADVREPRDLAPDLMGVKSRVSWSAIIGGSMIAIACYIVLTLLFAAVGISLTEAGVRANTVGIGVLVAMILTLVVSLFLGGWISSQLTVGENRQEAVIYGLLTWAMVTALSLAIVGMGVRAGYFAVVGGSMIAQNNERVPTFDDGMRQVGYTDAQIADIKSRFTPAAVRDAANNPENQEAARKAAMYSSWTALVATMLSMAAAVGGALAGRGATFRLFPVVTVRRDDRPRIIVPTA
jgi:hypothetical protein